jgi:hypothetical protein
MSRPRLSELQSDSTLYPGIYISAKVTVSLGESKVFFLCPAGHVLAKTTFATFAAKWY